MLPPRNTVWAGSGGQRSITDLWTLWWLYSHGFILRPLLSSINTQAFTAALCTWPIHFYIITTETDFIFIRRWLQRNRNRENFSTKILWCLWYRLDRSKQRKILFFKLLHITNLAEVRKKKDCSISCQGSGSHLCFEALSHQLKMKSVRLRICSSSEFKRINVDSSADHLLSGYLALKISSTLWY